MTTSEPKATDRTVLLQYAVWPQHRNLPTNCRFFESDSLRREMQDNGEVPPGGNQPDLDGLRMRLRAPTVGY